MSYNPVTGNPFTVPGTVAGYLDVRKKASANGGVSGPVVTVAVPAYTAPATSTITQLVFDGDSRTAGTNGQTPYPQLLQNSLGTANYGDYANIAVGGTGSGQVLARIPNTLYPRRDINTYPVGIYVLMIGINDWGAGGTGADSANTIKTIINGAVTNGYRVIVCTVPPVGQQYGSAYTPAQLEAERVKCNNQIKANWKTWGAKGMVDFAADNRLATPSNHTYFDNFDGLELHFTTAGNQVMSDLVGAAIPTVAGGGFYGTVTPIPTGPTSSLQPASGNARRYRATDAQVDGSGIVTSLADSLPSGDVLTPYGTTGPQKLSDNGVDYLQFNSATMRGSVNLGRGGSADRTLLVVVKLDNPSTNQDIAGYGGGQTTTGTICDLAVYNSAVIVHLAGTFSAGNAANSGYMVLGFIVSNGSLQVSVNGQLGGAQSLNTTDAPLRLGQAVASLGNAGFRFVDAIWRNDGDSSAFAANNAYLKDLYKI